MQCFWPRHRPSIMDFEADADVAALASLVDASRCACALHEAVMQSHAFDGDSGRVCNQGVLVAGDWPWCLPASLTTRDDFLELAVTCRALRAWCDEVDGVMQDRAAKEDDPTLRARLETAGWHITEVGGAALHLAALCVSATAGLWVRDVAERALRGACAVVRGAIFEFQRGAGV